MPVLTELMGYLATGLFLGALYAALAMPMNLIWVTTDVVDVSVGGYVVLGGIVAAAVGGITGILAGIGAAVVAGCLTGLLFLGFHRLAEIQNPMRIILATFAFLLIIESATQAFTGTSNVYLPRIPEAMQIAGVRVPYQGLFNLGVALAILTLFTLVLKRTHIGLRMRAAAMSSTSAELSGIAVRRTQFAAFVVGSGIAGLVGVLAAMTVGVSYSRALLFTVSAFSAVILFGLKSPARACMGGLALGVVQGLAAGYLPNGWDAAVPSLLILAVLTLGRFHQFSIRQVRA